jgi:hypothetical protein
MKAGAQPQTTQPPSVTSSSNVTIGHYVLGKSNPPPLNPYLGKALGKGTFGHVKQATHTLTGEKVRIWLSYRLICDRWP